MQHAKLCAFAYKFAHKKGMKKKYCNNCQKNVFPKNRFSWRWFIGGAILTAGLISVIYLFYFLATGDKHCETCGGNDFTKAKPEQ